jgi:hypothetical protein
MSAKEDCEKLMNELLPLAERMLSEFKEFYPYGAYMKPSGEIVHVGAQDEETEHPKARDLLYVLRSSFLDLAASGACRATAIVADIVVTPPAELTKSDAIQISLEHAEGYSAEVFVPYVVMPGNGVTYGQMFAHQGKNDIFGQT